MPEHEGKRCWIPASDRYHKKLDYASLKKRAKEAGKEVIKGTEAASEQRAESVKAAPMKVATSESPTPAHREIHTFRERFEITTPKPDTFNERFGAIYYKEFNTIGTMLGGRLKF